MLEHAISKFQHWKINRQLYVFLSVCIIVSTIIIYIVSTISYMYSYNEKSRELMQSHLSAMASMHETALDNYDNVIHAIIIDPNVQGFLRNYQTSQKINYGLLESAQNTLYNFSNMNGNIQSIVVLYGDPVQYLSKRVTLSSMMKYIQYYQTDYQAGIQAKAGDLKVNYNAVYSDEGKQYLTFYFPIYSSIELNNKMGLLCLTVKAPDIDRIYSGEDAGVAETVLLSSSGQIVADSYHKDTRSSYYEMSKLTDDKGYFINHGKMYVYQKIGDWNFYLLQSISLFDYIKSGARIILILSLMAAGCMILEINLSQKLVKEIYRPLAAFIMSMKSVSEGKLEVRMNLNAQGEDFIIMAKGFNSMMNEIAFLMEQIKEEQKQMEEIRFNVLQSQIKPHFLYNTLDCIHWKAVSEGDSTISTLVKALAAYYRICLSGGRDIISLQQETEHVRNYLIIQNMRYGDIIEYSIDIPEILYHQQIPKITLQPLVENSIYHGIRVKEGKKGKVAIKAMQDRDKVKIEISDNGTGMKDEQLAEINASISTFDKNNGYGLRNVHRRIEIIYGKPNGLVYARNSTGGVTVEITLPLRECIL